MPDWNQPIRQRLEGLNLDGSREAEIVEELSQHLEDRYRDMLSSGLSEDRAVTAALGELETDDLLARELRKTRQPADGRRAPLGATGPSSIFAGFRHDLKVALRIVIQKPAFAAMVAGILALGIASNAAIFSVFNGLFLRPLPFVEPSRLLDLDETAPKWDLTYVGISNFDAYHWMWGNTTFDGMAFFGHGGANLSDGSIASQRIEAPPVTYTLLDVLGLKPVFGRNILPKEDKPGGDNVILLGYDLWQRLYHGDRNILGHVLKLDGKPYTVIGILPREAALPPNADAWIPLAADPNSSGSYYLSGVGRLKHGVTIDQARADLTRVHKSFIKTQPVNEDTAPILQPLRDRYLGDFKTVTHILLGAVAVLLLIACVNIAGLMLVRGQSRARELGIRMALGASRARIVRHLFTESCVLAMAGGILGVALGEVCLRALVSLMPDDIPRWVEFGMDFRFVFFCVAVIGASAILFSLAPAVDALRVNAHGSLQETARVTFSRARRGMLGVLVVGEIALALMLLVGSGLLVQAFRKILNVDPGFRPHNVLTWSLDPPASKYKDGPSRYAFYHELIERLKSVPGVERVSAADLVPLGGHNGYFFVAEGARQLGPQEKNPVVLGITAMAGYFETMGLTFVGGRGFDERDEQPNQPHVAIVNESFVKWFWPGQNGVGKRISYAFGKPGKEDWLQVVGVVRDTAHYGLDGEHRPSVFATYPYAPQRAMTIAIRSGIDPHALVAPAREVIRQMDPDLPMFKIHTMTERLDHSLWTRRAYSWLFGAFAAVALLLAAAGIYGVISFSVSRRTREIGIRMALGARPAQVMRGVLADGMLLVGAGAALGLAAAYFAASLLRTMLFGVSPRDLFTYAAVAAMVALVGVAANYVPARRASRVDPNQALRFE
ncbi:MAG: ABC transporter permease [Bryobacteraceae bacterium]|jgi:predicted permease